MNKIIEIKKIGRKYEMVLSQNNTNIKVSKRELNKIIKYLKTYLANTNTNFSLDDFICIKLRTKCACDTNLKCKAELEMMVTEDRLGIKFYIFYSKGKKFNTYKEINLNKQEIKMLLNDYELILL